MRAALSIPAARPLNSLVIESATIVASAVTFGQNGDVLTISSGGIISGDDNAARSIGTNAIRGVLDTTGPEMFIHQGANILTVNSVIGTGDTFNLVMDGMSQANSQQIILTAPNNYVGTTYVSGVTVDLSNTTGSGLAVTGNLVINGGNNNGTDSLAIANSLVRNFANSQIASTATLTIPSTAEYNSAGYNQTLNNIVFNSLGGDNGGNGPLVTTGSGVLDFLTGATAISASNVTDVRSIPVIMGNLTLPGTTALSVSPPVRGHRRDDQWLHQLPDWFGNRLQHYRRQHDHQERPGRVGIRWRERQRPHGQRRLQRRHPHDPDGGVQHRHRRRRPDRAGHELELCRHDDQHHQRRGRYARSRESPGGFLERQRHDQELQSSPPRRTLVTGGDNTNTAFSGLLTSDYSSGLLSVTKIGSGTWSLSAGNAGPTTFLGTLTVEDGASVGSPGSASGGVLSGRALTPAIGFQSCYSLEPRRRPGPGQQRSGNGHLGPARRQQQHHGQRRYRRRASPHSGGRHACDLGQQHRYGHRNDQQYQPFLSGGGTIILGRHRHWPGEPEPL